ncbi:MAG TPA: hypothetical protein VGP03_04545 [Pseudonocardiaceae bacterium]|jgi:hypothetical protein|nr:hypothetical protein [Pseudonocardiaceae bacterium]
MAPQTSQGHGTPLPPSLHQPRRALIAMGELVLVVLFVLGAVWCWRHGVVRSEYPVEGRAPLESTRYSGTWIGTAIGLTTLGALFLLDAVRQLVLAGRARPREQKDMTQATEWDV